MIRQTTQNKTKLNCSKAMMNNDNKVLFKDHDLHGIKSFKIQSCHLQTELKHLIGDMRKECVDRLQFGMSRLSKPQDGITIAIEGPTCCPNYAQFNIDRSVPLRQYFGKNFSEEVDGIITRWSYGLGSGSSTVGGDLQTSKTRPLTITMKKMCDELQKLCDSDVEFNHVTVLYYLTDKYKHRSIELKKHCDVERTAMNTYKKSNSQKFGTPTIVLSLFHPKTVKMFKRYVTEKQGRRKSFDKEDHFVGNMLTGDGDIFYLSPEDESVIHREIMNIDTGMMGEEKQASNFRHAVRCSINDDYEELNLLEKISVSVCFRQTIVKREYNIKTDTMIRLKDMDGNEEDQLYENNRNKKRKAQYRKVEAQHTKMSA